MVVNHLLTGMTLELDGGFKYVFIFVCPYLGKMAQFDEHIFETGLCIYIYTYLDQRTFACSGSKFHGEGDELLRVLL